MENAEFVDACRRYDDAPEEAFQLKVNAVGWFDEPFPGAARTGAGGAAAIVAQFQEAEYELVPPEFEALTRQ